MNNNLLVLLIDETKNDDGQAILELVKYFKPIILKYANKLKYDDAELDMQSDFISIIVKLQNNHLHNESDKYILSYIKKSMYHSYIKYSKINRNHSKELPITSFDNDTQYIADNNLYTYNYYSSVALDEIKTLLTNKEFLVIKYIIFNDYSINDIAQTLGVSRQNINQTKNRAFKKIRKFYEERGVTRGYDKSHRNVCT